MRDPTYVSMGRNPNVELTCCAPRCAFLHKGPQDGGWCRHPENRVEPSEGWPLGFTPSVASTGGCARHSAAEQETP
jgi:hypothetical protein